MPKRAPREQTTTVATLPPKIRAIGRIRRIVKLAWMVQERTKFRIREEIVQIPGLMALLMKPRNGEKWTPEDRTELRAQLRSLSRLSLYLATAALPGTTLALPLLAWWLDQRQKKRPLQQTP